ncbi:hypothetical protein LPJ53_005697 [Coemansia erecta]|uniref:EamA domain-containing protein n=1 Tax=Coemansia erecta TaxID=147472 RepID=A0A9W7XUE8_9FUNG|nr:hypothetical protein LPJ53_005697 [Coemansia erecta]
MPSEFTRLSLPSVPGYNATAAAGGGSSSGMHLAARRTRRKGLGLAGLSAVAFALMTLLVRMLSDQGFTALQIMAWRCIVQTVAASLASLAIGVRPLHVPQGWRNFRWVLVRAVCGGLGHLLYYAALAHLPMGVATVLFFTNPLWTALVARWALDEPFDRRQRWLALTCLLGIALVVAPSSPLLLLLGGASAWSLAALLGALSVAVAYVSIRLAGRAVHPMVHVVYFGIVGAVGNTAASLWLAGEPWRWPDAAVAAWAMVGGVGVMAFLAQFLMNWGLQLASAGPVVMMRNVDIAIGFVLDAALYQTVPSAASSVGAAVIAFCVISMGASG